MQNFAIFFALIKLGSEDSTVTVESSTDHGKTLKI